MLIFLLKVQHLAALLRRSQHLVAHTGAGISTAASIPDFRGPQGVWTREKLPFAKREELSSVAFEEAVPTQSHMALARLHALGILRFLVTQNVDGLHRKSGLPAQSLAEVHGCIYDEYCHKCGHKVTRGFDVNSREDETDKHSPDMHSTGRLCAVAGCRGTLQDTIVHFGEALREPDAMHANQNSKQADLALCIGTSLQVKPAADYPLHTVQAGGKLVIINLQPTPLDDRCTLRIFARCDVVFQLLFACLQEQVPRFTLRTKATIAVEELSSSSSLAPSPSKPRQDQCCWQVTLSVEDDSYIERLDCWLDSGKHLSVDKPPFVTQVRTSSATPANLPQKVNIRISFCGFGGREPLQVALPLAGLLRQELLLEHTPVNGKITGGARRARKLKKIAAANAKKKTT